jgi:hypothetical protein
MSRKFLNILIMIFLFGCNNGTTDADRYPPDNHNLVTINHGLYGNVWYWSGAFQGLNWGTISPVSRTLYFYDITPVDSCDVYSGDFYKKIHGVLVDSVKSQLNGFYQIDLPPGNYSILTWENDLYYANRKNLLDSLDDTEYIQPIIIYPDSLEYLVVNLTYDAIF